MKLRTVLIATAMSFLVGILAQPAQAVRPLPTYTPVPLDSPEPQAGTAQAPGAFFGEHMDVVGDIDHDGVNDVAISSTRQDSAFLKVVGRVWVFSGRTRDVLRTFQNPDPQEGKGFGDSILGIDDVNGDGTRDVAIGAAVQSVYTGSGTPCGAPEPNGCNEAQGRVYVFSGRTESVIRRIEHPEPQASAFFGYGNPAATNDVNGDGVGDFVEPAVFQNVDAPCDDDDDPSTPPVTPCPFVGVAYAFSGKTGSLIHAFRYPGAPKAYSNFTNSVSNQGDVTGDGVDDIVIGVGAFLFSGKTGGLVRKLEPPPEAGGYGYGRPTGILPGDVNRDGVRDMFVGAPGTSVGGVENAGRGYLLDGRDGSLIRTLDDPSPKKIGSLGANYTNAGDVNGDGTDELLLSRFVGRLSIYGGEPPGAAAYLFDPRTGEALVSLPGMSIDGPGSPVVSPGDVNGDGYPDYFLGGAWMDATGAETEEKGRVIVELSKAPPTSPQPRPPVSPAAGKLKTSLTIKARPKRDRRLPFRYRFSGRVRIPTGANKAVVCGGRIKLRLKKGAKTVAKGTAKVAKGCTYRKRVSIRTTTRTGTSKGKLKVNARFGGNARLKSSKKGTTVRFF